MKILKGISQDCTFNQESFKNVIPKQGPYQSTDLSNCTDRLPICLQKRILSNIIGVEKATAWENIMVAEPFAFNGELYPYRVGQPMGAYSSFPMMALTNHVLIRVAAKRAEMPRFTKYSVLGDDMCLASQKVDTHLRQILNDLGVGISQKSYRGKLFNFAKRYFFEDHKEISGYSINGL